MIRNPFAASTGRRLRSSTARAVTLGAAAVLALGLTASLGPASASTRTYGRRPSPPSSPPRTRGTSTCARTVPRSLAATRGSGSAPAPG